LVLRFAQDDNPLLSDLLLDRNRGYLAVKGAKEAVLPK